MSSEKNLDGGLNCNYATDKDSRAYDEFVCYLDFQRQIILPNRILHQKIL